MTKADLVEKAHARTGVAKDRVREVIDATFSELGEALASGESYMQTGFGKFSVHLHAERTGCNPRTGEKITIPASRRIKFSPGKALKERLNS